MRRLDPRLTAAIVLTGGGSTRMGRHKPALVVGGRPIIVRILEAAQAHRTVVVGRPDAVPDGVLVVQDKPPGGGPVTGVAAGLTAIDGACARDDAPGPELVAVLAGDLPFLTAAPLAELFAALAAGPDEWQRPDVALVADREGSLNWLCAVWRTDVLRARLAALEAHATPAGLAGVSMRRLTSNVRRVQVLDAAGWSTDVDTPEELAAARRRPDR